MDAISTGLQRHAHALHAIFRYKISRVSCYMALFPLSRYHTMHGVKPECRHNAVSVERTASTQIRYPPTLTFEKYNPRHEFIRVDATIRTSSRCFATCRGRYTRSPIKLSQKAIRPNLRRPLSTSYGRSKHTQTHTTLKSLSRSRERTRRVPHQ